MKLKFIYSLLILGASTSYLQAQTKKTTTPTNKATAVKSSVQEFSLKTSNDSLSYALGIDVAKNLKNAGFDVSTEVFHKGLVAALKEEKLLLTEEQNMDIIQGELVKAYEKKNAELKKPGEDFLAKNKARPEVKVTPEGVQYEVLKEGDGPQATADSEVEVHYKGTLMDGTQFDSSYDRNESLTLDLNRVIEGWKIGIPLMKVGSKYKFYIPYNLAYGERATGSIPAFSALIFEVELLGIKAE
ncbi:MULTISPECIES: FKBP-type peptidyl-prolyl cis-trans isomerase [Sphingobacterium]|uniref:Peptidyl-prolyl cis-trans isomerase n=1 Tax=Sphingobacterium litopenaei TaxID=2763500 RepID=A0ABR7YFF1_9SPHI|nr:MULTISPECIES: FKBP-type peptidyl-prolyl cis-trans isomerase [Sphingobacterium]MBD1429994.1 FKBP-type peptidyl-prolyl cis-trans isomerase [Sphingobacterium litopenaei]NGM72295.1 FKBP-type peptidyl-prolyl cis-trans isomerase [Sphingobacterium sp. SGL-16]